MICKFCQSVFDKTSSGLGRPRQFCSSLCKSRSWDSIRKARRQAITTHNMIRLCINCRTPFVSVHFKKYCSLLCRRGLPVLEEGVCKFCQSVFDKKYHKHVYCSKYCYTKGVLEERSAKSLACKTAHPRQCEVCGSDISTKRSQALVCSKLCLRRRKAQRNRFVVCNSLCKGCGGVFKQKRLIQKFCSKSCAVDARVRERSAMLAALRILRTLRTLTPLWFWQVPTNAQFAHFYKQKHYISHKTKRALTSKSWSIKYPEKVKASGRAREVAIRAMQLLLSARN